MTLLQEVQLNDTTLSRMPPDSGFSNCWLIKDHFTVTHFDSSEIK